MQTPPLHTLIRFSPTTWPPPGPIKPLIAGYTAKLAQPRRARLLLHGPPGTGRLVLADTLLGWGAAVMDFYHLTALAPTHPLYCIDRFTGLIGAGAARIILYGLEILSPIQQAALAQGLDGLPVGSPFAIVGITAPPRGAHPATLGLHHALEEALGDLPAVYLSPLHERPVDVVPAFRAACRLLCMHLSGDGDWKLGARAWDVPLPEPTPAVQQILTAHTWPLNEQMVVRAALEALQACRRRGWPGQALEMRLEDLPAWVHPEARVAHASIPSPAAASSTEPAPPTPSLAGVDGARAAYQALLDAGVTLDEAIDGYTLHVVQACGWGSRPAAAKRLGRSVRWLAKLLRSKGYRLGRKGVELSGRVAVR